MTTPTLTIGMANWDDPEGAWWTLSSLRLHHPVTRTDRVELLVCDDMPAPNADLVTVCRNAQARYQHCGTGRGPAAAKDQVFHHGRGRLVLLLDAHVILAPGAVDLVLAESDTIGRDMWTGPLLSESGSVIATEMDPVLRGDFLGIWAVRDAETDRRPIHAHGSALMAMSRDAWPGFSPHFRGFGGEEVYIHDAVRRRGGRVLYRPAVGWVHRFGRFGRPVTYPLSLNDKVRNYAIAAHESGWNTPQIWQYFTRRLPSYQRAALAADLVAIYPDIFAADYSGIPRFSAMD